jgi:hypothetical protein
MHITNQLNKEDINQLNRSSTSNEIEAITKSLPTTKNPGTDGFMAEFLKKNINH